MPVLVSPVVVIAGNAAVPATKAALCDASIITAVVPAVCMFNMPVLSAVVITPPAPLVEAFILEAIYFSYNTTQRCPLGTVTVAPEATVIGPILNPLVLVVNV